MAFFTNEGDQNNQDEDSLFEDIAFISSQQSLGDEEEQKKEEQEAEAEEAEVEAQEEVEAERKAAEATEEHEEELEVEKGDEQEEGEKENGNNKEGGKAQNLDDAFKGDDSLGAGIGKGVSDQLSAIAAKIAGAGAGKAQEVDKNRSVDAGSAVRGMKSEQGNSGKEGKNDESSER